MAALLALAPCWSADKFFGSSFLMGRRKTTDDAPAI